MNWYWLVAAGTAGLFTFLEVDKTFYIPEKVDQKFQLYLLIWGFVLANSLLAALSYWALQDSPLIQDMPEWFRSFLIGLSYLTLVRQKLASISTEKGEVSIGIELLYNSVRYSVYKRINRIAKKARRQAALELSRNKSLADLKREAELSIAQDALLTEEERQKERDFVNSTYADAKSDEQTRALTLADYILSQQLRG